MREVKFAIRNSKFEICNLQFAICNPAMGERAPLPKALPEVTRGLPAPPFGLRRDKPAAVTSRHQRVAVWPLILRSSFVAHRAHLPVAHPEVATLDIVRAPISDLSATRIRTMSKVALPPNAPCRSGWVGERFTFNVQLSTLDFQLPWTARPIIAPLTLRVGWGNV